MTTYAWDTRSGLLLAVWAAGVGHHAAMVCQLGSAAAPEVTARLCDAMTQLSQHLWDTYQHPADDDDSDLPDLAAQERGEGFSGVLAAVGRPHLPDTHGLLIVSYDPVLESAHTVGRALHELGDAEVTVAVTAEVRTEIDAVGRAGLGDLSGRAAQAVSLDRLDVSPVQVAAADRLLHADPLGSDALFTSVDPAAACVAAAHWLVAAAEVTAAAAGIAPTDVFTYADDLEALSVEVPSYVVDVVVDQSATPLEAVTGLLTEAAAVRAGRIPNPTALLQRVDAAREQILRVDVGHREQALAVLLDRLTPLDPQRPARDLLEHLLDGLRACLLVYREEKAVTAGVTTGAADEDDLFDTTTDLAEAAFTAAVRHQAGRVHDRLTG
ncbi:hypothetical protein OHA72_10055 [Dactylosporangium sp. NBC_01737]|uniref:hypothetical protein n=1 Tax=Dactylosporangium sp. NBC_01737 TaxID=2975959 RepID=UPI002E0F69AD|nr:hypothetical protein OHA72_10055 [Dactylosporangium sp. NBC_01737]